MERKTAYQKMMEKKLNKPEPSLMERQKNADTAIQALKGLKLHDNKDLMKEVERIQILKKYDILTEDFGVVLTCAVRYALGRQTYIPSLVINFITPLLSSLDDKTLWCLEKDISNAESWGGYGNENIDRPKWIEFLDKIRIEINKRKQ